MNSTVCTHAWFESTIRRSVGQYPLGGWLDRGWPSDSPMSDDEPGGLFEQHNPDVWRPEELEQQREVLSLLLARDASSSSSGDRPAAALSPLQSAVAVAVTTSGTCMAAVGLSGSTLAACGCDPCDCAWW